MKIINHDSTSNTASFSNERKWRFVTRKMILQNTLMNMCTSFHGNSKSTRWKVKWDTMKYVPKIEYCKWSTAFSLWRKYLSNQQASPHQIHLSPWSNKDRAYSIRTPIQPQVSDLLISIIIFIFHFLVNSLIPNIPTF